MFKKLAKIHSDYDVYPKELKSENADKTILDVVEQVEDLAYLHIFYNNYLDEYFFRNSEVVQDENRSKLSGAARSVDLPFVGNKVLEFGKAKYMFVFEGSLQLDYRFSITVLSCFWIFKNAVQYKSIIDNYWRFFNYNFIKDCLDICPEIAEHSYVVDSFRIANANGKRDTRVNREMLLSEIRLINPELIVLVGGTARDILGHQFISENKSKIELVPFPTVRRTTDQKIDAEARYTELSRRLKEIQDTRGNG